MLNVRSILSASSKTVEIVATSPNDEHGDPYAGGEFTSKLLAVLAGGAAFAALAFQGYRNRSDFVPRKKNLTDEEIQKLKAQAEQKNKDVARRLENALRKDQLFNLTEESKIEYCIAGELSLEAFHILNGLQREGVNVTDPYRALDTAVTSFRSAGDAENLRRVMAMQENYLRGRVSAEPDKNLQERLENIARTYAAMNDWQGVLRVRSSLVGYVESVGVSKFERADDYPRLLSEEARALAKLNEYSAAAGVYLKAAELFYKNGNIVEADRLLASAKELANKVPSPEPSILKQIEELEGLDRYILNIRKEAWLKDWTSVVILAKDAMGRLKKYGDDAKKGEIRLLHGLGEEKNYHYKEAAEAYHFAFVHYKNLGDQEGMLKAGEGILRCNVGMFEQSRNSRFMISAVSYFDRLTIDMRNLGAEGILAKIAEFTADALVPFAKDTDILGVEALYEAAAQIYGELNKKLEEASVWRKAAILMEKNGKPSAASSHFASERKALSLRIDPSLARLASEGCEEAGKEFFRVVKSFDPEITKEALSRLLISTDPKDIEKLKLFDLDLVEPPVRAKIAKSITGESLSGMGKNSKERGKK